MAMDTVMAAMVSTANSNRARLFLLTCLVSTATWSGDWKFASGVTLSERYTDNVDLEAAGFEQSDWITEITPRISVRRDGRRLKVNADYSLQGLLYANDTNSNEVHHNLNGRANAELVEEWFYLDATARVDQVLDSLGGGIGLGDGVGTKNTSTVGSYTLTPYLKHRFGSLATVEARVTQDGVFSGNSGVADTATRLYQLSAISGSGSLPVSWHANYDNSNTRSNSNLVPGSSYENAFADARVAITRKFSLVAQAGMEKNDFLGVDPEARDFSYYGLGVSFSRGRWLSMDVLYNLSDDGDFWSWNASLNPTPRTKINASATDRAYGRSYSLDLSHRARRSNWSLRYSDGFTTSQQQFIGYVGTVYVYNCPGGKEYLPPGALPSDPVNCTFEGIANINSPVEVNGVYLTKDLSGSVSYTLRRNTWVLSLYDNRREYQSSSDNETTRGLRASWSLRPAVHTTFTLTGGMSYVESTGTDDRQDDHWDIGLIATRQFMPKVSGSVEARHQESDSNQPGDDYAENSVAAHLNVTF
jgi:uncharacterized protein (PEP-CTERM system associated)